jgi:type II secretory pathway pseudopilin PulG
MVVVAIIGVFSAIAIPGIMEIQYRNVLSDSVERLRSAAAAARDVAMQTRQAAVLEVSGTDVWINLIEGPRCTGAIVSRCTTNLGDATGVIKLVDSDANATAGVALIGGAVLTLSSGGSPQCNTPVALPSDGFALCYSGKGELFYRVGTDNNTACGLADTTPPPPFTGWRSQKACSTPSLTHTNVGGTDVGLWDGAAVLMNRMEGGDPIDVARGVVFPANGAPMSRLVMAGDGDVDTDTN